jgi:TonB family protein
MKGLLKTSALIAGLAPAAAIAHCCCDGHRHHEARVSHRAGHHRVVRTEDWDSARFQVTAARPCHYPQWLHGVTGVSVVKMRVDGDGFVRAVRLGDSSGSPALDRAALACVSGWHLSAGYEWRVARVVWRWHWTSWG